MLETNNLAKVFKLMKINKTSHFMISFSEPAAEFQMSGAQAPPCYEV